MTQLDVDRICVVIGRTRHAMVQMEIQEAARQGARLLEIRLDFLKKAPDFHRLLGDKPCPLVATVRRAADGGKWDGSEEARQTLLRQAIVSGFDWVDLETDVADRIPRFGRVRRIVSYHNFREVPADLERIHERMSAQDADVVKIAARAQSQTDNLRMLELLRRATRPTVAFCMGDLGFPSRILGARLGSPFTYASFNRERVLAPGMPTFFELKNVYHYHEINAETRVFGVIGDPVAHSLSPLLHNLCFRKMGVNAVYLPFRVPREQLSAFLAGFATVPVDGYSVTLPHKEAAAVAAKHPDSTVTQTQAANTLLRTEDGFAAYNTDYQGVVDTLNTLLPGFARRPARDPHDPEATPLWIPTAGIQAGPPSGLPQAIPASLPLQSKVALVLGAGGVARAVAHALHREGALVTLCNRTPERAQELATEVGCKFVDWNARHSALCDLLINCTPVGMHPNVDESPIHPSYLKAGLVVFDTVYVPEQTLLVKEARARDCHVITGVELFVRQAALQFRHFTGLSAPLDYLTRIVRRALSPVTIKDDEF